jgi:hypothetical protein
LAKYLTNLLGDNAENIDRLTSGQYDEEILKAASEII